MEEVVCEEIAHRAGFTVSVGNWISPEGLLIVGENYDTHHWETIKNPLGYEPETENHLRWMNEQVSNGYIRLVFRADVFFQVGCDTKEDIWSEKVNLKKLREILSRIPEIEIHIFSKNFYIIGLADDILNRRIDRLQIQEK